MHPLPLIDDALFIDNSSLEKFTTCPRSAQHYICDKRESSDERVALAYGKNIHSILEARYKHHPNVIPPGTESATGVQEVGTGVRMVNAATAAFANWTTDNPEEFRNYSTAVDLITAYNLHYPVEAFEVVALPNGQPAIEVPFAVPLGEIEVNSELLVRNPDGTITTKYLEKLKIIHTGRIDLIYKREGRYYIMDHKTTSMMGPTYFKEFDLSSQVMAYLWAAGKLLGAPVNGFVVNAIATRKQTPKGKRFEFERYPILADRVLIDEWAADTLYICSDLVEMAKRGYFPKHTKWCVGKYGLCQYAQVCCLPPTSRPIMLASGNFKKVEWNPLDQHQQQ